MKSCTRLEHQAFRTSAEFRTYMETSDAIVRGKYNECRREILLLGGKGADSKPRSPVSYEELISAGLIAEERTTEHGELPRTIGEMARRGTHPSNGKDRLEFVRNDQRPACESRLPSPEQACPKGTICAYSQKRRKVP